MDQFGRLLEQGLRLQVEIDQRSAIYLGLALFFALFLALILAALLTQRL